MNKGLFVNSDKACCSIFESNHDIYQILSKGFDMDYMETTSPQYVTNKLTESQYDYIVVNYHFTVNRHMIKPNFNTNIPLIGFNLEMLPGNANVDCSLFDAVCIPDPTLTDYNNVFSFPRPILNFTPNKEEHLIPIIGYNGFATPGKPCDKFAHAINQEFKKGEVIVKLNFPTASYIPLNESPNLIPQRYMNEIKSMLNGIDTIDTSHYFSKQDLLNWVSSCDLMIYHYYRNMAGLCATTDQAISAETPISISDCSTFRHLHPYTNHWPNISLKESLNQKNEIKKMKQDWSEDNFRKRFSDVLQYVQKKMKINMILCSFGGN